MGDIVAISSLVQTNGLGFAEQSDFGERRQGMQVETPAGPFCQAALLGRESSPGSPDLPTRYGSRGGDHSGIHGGEGRGQGGENIPGGCGGGG